MQISASRSGGFAGGSARLGPVDTERVSGAISSAISRALEEMRFFDLPGETKASGAFDDVHCSVHVADGERQHTVSFDELSDDPTSVKLKEFVGLLQRGGFDFEELKPD